MEDTHLPDQSVTVRIPVGTENIREELNFYKDLRSCFREYNKPIEDIDFVIRNLENSVAIFDSGSPIVIDEEKMASQIRKHPYFKNPCDYPIRLITILKYLKRKGFNMNYADIDIYVDKLLQRMDDVKKVGRGLYQVSRNQ